MWRRMVDDLFESLYIDKVTGGDSSLASYMAFVEDCISGRESSRFEEGINTTVKLNIYKRYIISVEFKEYVFTWNM